MNLKNSKEQYLASDPDYSIWLSASAGTGKTKVLTDRVLRLLISGAEPHRILCLTFTNAAANEMRERIYKKISKWSIITKKNLKLEIETLKGSNATDEEVVYAQNLLSNHLQKSDSLNIYTIHSFCQKILKQFPIEAGVSPNFKIIDEINQQKIFASIKYTLIVDKDLKALVTSLLSQMHETKLNELIEEILNDRIKFKYLFEKFSNSFDYQQYLQHILKINPSEDSISIIQDTKLFILKYVDRILICDIKKLLADYLEASSEDILEKWSKLKNFFLTQDESKKKKLLTKAKQAEYPDQLEYLLLVQDIVFETTDRVKTFKLLESSIKLYDLAKGVIEKYEAYKNQKSFIDYDDLIYYTHQLFTKSEFKDWILYKLDGGIEHILVDEAQDTNLNQWKLVLAMINDFVAGESANKVSKSIFVVGDEKQSIYSFQGAEYEQFNKIKTQILQQLANSQKKYQVINLGTSYRSAEIILNTVNQIFHHVRSKSKDLFDSDNFGLNCCLKDYGGKVELWPIYQNSKTSEVFWPIIKEEASEDAQSRLAKDIASYIKDCINSKKVLYSTQKAAQPQDFMILLRQRNNFAHQIVKELKALRVPVSGLDRIDLFDDLSVQDLLSAAKFVLFPEDELNLAGLLKSPIINLTDNELYELSHNRVQNLNTKIQTESQYLLVKNQLNQIITLASNVTISDFFYILVYGYDNLSRFLAMNSHESSDSINELINLALKFEHEISGSMQEFVAWCNACDIEITRDTNSGNVVRIMTVHGSKGLQAPIVILPETTSMPKASGKFLWNNNFCPFFTIRTNQSCQFYDDLKQGERSLQYKEYLRLLYVATTRACEQLVFCGYTSNEDINENCWYNLVSSAIKPTLTAVEYKDQNIFISESLMQRPVASFSQDKTKSIPLINLTSKATYTSKIQTKNLFPNSPLNVQNSAIYGQIIHKILEDSFVLGNFENLLKSKLLTLLPEDYLKVLIPKLSSLEQNPEFQSILQSETKTEVSIGSNIDYKIGRIDLLSITQNKITIIDYKTDAKVPDSINEVPIKYLEQLESYKKAMQCIYPQHKVEAKILWIMRGSFMQIF
jgi:ATP-dependent helicase/nuclease subunit A